MNKREFLGTGLRLALVAGLPMAGAGSALAQGAPYQTLKFPQNTRNPDKIEVLEYFWFGCPHCYAFEPAINEWAANRPDDVDFVREAPPLNKGWTAHSEAFYAVEVLGETEKFFEPLFNAIHREKRNLRDRKRLAAFAAEVGIDEKKMLDTMKSFAVNTRIRQAMKNAMEARVSGVPSVVVNGKYLTSVSMAGGHKQIIQVIDELIERERQSA